jgi:hypothetical protein
MSTGMNDASAQKMGMPRYSGGNPSYMVSASKGLGSAGGIETDSAHNLISKAQVHEVIKGLNVSIS